MLVLFFLIIDSYVLIPAAIAQTFNTISELVIPIGIPSKEAKADIEIHLVTGEAMVRKFSMYFRVVQTILCLLFINSFWSTSIWFLLYFSI